MRGGRAALLLALAGAPAAAARAGDPPPVEIRAADEGDRPLAEFRAALLRTTSAGPFDPAALLAAGESAAAGGRVLLAPPAGPGRLLAAAAAAGRAPTLAWVVEAGPTRLVLPPAGPVEVVVLSAPAAEPFGPPPPRRPIPGALVTVRGAAPAPGAPAWFRAARAGEDGVARFADLDRDAPLAAEATAPGHAPAGAALVFRGVPLEIPLPPSGRLAGRVVRVPGGGPVAGARVRAGEGEAVTGADGTFTLEGLLPGPVTVDVAAEGLLTLDRPSLRIDAGGVATLADIRCAAPARVSVLVQDPAGRPLGRVPVALLPPGAGEGAAPAGTLTGSDGRATVAGVAPAAGHRLLLDPGPPWAPRLTEAFAALPGEAIDLGAVRLDAGGVLEGVVAGPDGHAPEGIRLVLGDGEADPLRVFADDAAAGPLRRAVAVDPDGAFRVERVPAGVRGLFAAAPDRRPAAVTGIAVAAGATKGNLRLELVPGLALAGTLRSSAGEAVRDALVAALHPITGVETGRARTGPGGAFRIEGLLPGPCRLRVVLPGEAFPDPLRPLVPAVVPGAGLLLRLPALAAVEGVVVDPAGGDVRARVLVLRPAAPGEEAAPPEAVETVLAGGDGAFTTRPLPAGRWRLRAESPEGRVAVADLETAEGEEPPRVILTLARGAALRGRILAGPAVKDLSRVEIRLRPGGRAADAIPAPPPGPDGTFVLPGTPPGEHTLVVAVPGLAPSVLAGILVEPGGAIVDVGDILLGRGASLRVRVHGESRAPLEGVDVSLVDAAGLRREERTNAGGLALFGGLAAGPHAVDLLLPGGTRLRRAVDVLEDGEREIAVDLGLERPGLVEVRREGRPVPGAALRVHAADGGGSVEGIADDRGVARLPALPEGEVLVEVAPPGEPAVRGVHTVVDGRLALHLPADGLEGEVVARRDGKPVAGARLVARPLHGAGAEVLAPHLLGRGAAVAADGGGRFRFPSLAPGLWVIEVAAKGFGTFRSAPVEVLSGGGRRPLRLALEEGGRLEGRVLDTAGAPYPGAVVEVTDPATGHLLPGGRGASDAAGAYRFEGLPPGPFVITARAGGLGASPPERGSLAAGETRTADLGLVEGGTLEVSVVGPGGRPVAGAVVHVEDVLGFPVPSPARPDGPLDPWQPEGRTGADGRLRLPGLRAGIYVVRATREDLTAEVRVRMDARGGARAVVALLPPAAPPAPR